MPNLKQGHFLLIAVFAGAACHTRQPAAVVAPAAPPQAAVVSRPAAPPPAPRAVAASRPVAAALTEAEMFQQKSLDQLNAERPLADAFFDFDQQVLREDAQAALQRDAQWLVKWPQTTIRVDGLADERGSAEYDLALGERRADAVKAYLANLGVRPQRVDTRTLGKEMPFCNLAVESCWSQNRRGHIVITAK